MNNEQQPNITPDYGYVMGQQLPSQNKQGPDKRIVFIIVCVVLLGVVLLVGLVFGSSSSKNNQGNVTGPAAQQIISFNDALKSEDYQKAARISAWSQPESNQSVIAGQIKESAKLVDYSTCTVTKVITNGDGWDVDNACMSADGKTKLTTTYVIVQSGESYYITGARYGASKV